ncbi:2-oxoglutarate-dependent dioxygenase DAO-like [Carica papaya]|uniref:2-oxoglutarate-dependent dioxygenase DAO-like n=1 Tax=Carica papaya TaxID=3649 RepID=UPI000B8D058B|nr:2-oxoglutarate-dependent dioxygenase DAO-like [Carica papaya]
MSEGGIPTIDIEDFPAQMGKLREACEKWGCFRLVNHKIPLTLMSWIEMGVECREIIKVYAKAVHGVGMEIAGKLAESLGIISSSGESEEIFRDWACQFRINKYNFTPETVGLSGVQMHTDSGFLTILQDDENNGGLEVMDNSTGEFLSVEPLPGSLVVNLGDMAAVWSNGRVSNVKHRVQCKKGEVRASIASFVLGPKERVEAPTQLVDSEHPRYMRL